MKALVIMKTLPLAIQVCTSLSVEDARTELNAVVPCGTENGWCFDIEQGSCDCADNPGRQHLVFVA